MKEADGQTVLDFLNKTGWKEGYQFLRKLHETLEWKQADLYADPETVMQASKMSHTLLKQDTTLLIIEKEAKEKGIDLGELHCKRNRK